MQYQRLMAIGVGVLLSCTMVVSAISFIQSNQTIGVLKEISDRQEPVRQQFDQLRQLIHEAELRFLAFSRPDEVSKSALTAGFLNLTHVMEPFSKNTDRLHPIVKHYATARTNLDKSLIASVDRSGHRTDTPTARAAIKKSSESFLSVAREVLLYVSATEGISEAEIQSAATALNEVEVLFHRFSRQPEGRLAEVVKFLNGALEIVGDMMTSGISMSETRSIRRLEAMRDALGTFKAAVVLFADERDLAMGGDTSLAATAAHAHAALQKAEHELQTLQQAIAVRVVALQVEQQDTLESQRLAYLSVIVFAVIFAFTAAYLLKTLLNRRIGALVEATRNIARGNLSDHISEGPADQIGEIGRAINSMAKTLREREDAHQLAEEKLRHAQKMEAVGQLTGGVAHDFNNLLQVVYNNLELIKLKLGNQDNEILGFLDRAASAAKHGGSLTQQLLSFSRRQTLFPKTVDPAELIDEFAQMLEWTLGEDIEIVSGRQRNSTPITVDPNALKSAILNIGLNARAAMPHGGKLTISIADTRLGDDFSHGYGKLRAGDYVEISVTDTGHGMSPEVSERAFEPFFTTKNIGEGSGLGLSMVYGFVRQSEGHVTLESEVGKGTTVRLLFPTSEIETGAIEVKPKPLQANANIGSILIVEDDPLVRGSAATILENLGFNTQTAVDGRTALDILEKDSTIDLLFTDVVMPGGMNGIELAEEASRRYKGIKVLLTSGYPEDALEKSGLAESKFRMLRKPYSAEELSRTLSALFKD